MGTAFSSCLQASGDIFIPKKSGTRDVGKSRKESVYYSAQGDPIESVYFDAVEELQDDHEALSVYAPATTGNRHPRMSISMEDPDTMLCDSKPHATTKRRRSSVFVRQRLQKPRVEVQVRGYPGDLTEEELKACLEFRRGLKEKDEAYREMVDSFKDVEEEPYALCRFMRSRGFDVEQVFDTLMEPSISHWKKAKEQNFYPSVEEAVGCSPSVFLTQYPYLFHGNAKNGCPVAYFMAGRFQTSGIECVTDLAKVNNYAWHTIMHQFTKQVAIAQKSNPNIVRCENVAVFDLEGLSSSQLNETSFEVMSNLGYVTGCFPELLNRLVVVNAPYFFGMTWPVIKSFLDPRTAAKIEIYSNTKNGKKRLAELIDKNFLLANYDGKAPSFDQLTQKQGHENGATRQLHQLLTIKPNSESRWDFELKSKEKTTVTVYTRSKEGASITLSKKGESGSPAEIQNDSGTPYSAEIASIQGPGKFRLAARPKSTTDTDCFLVIAEVFPL